MKFSQQSITHTLFFFGLSAAAAFAKEEKHNVVFIIADDLMPMFGCYGDPVVRSPSMDALAGEGVVFLRNYCQQALCSPSRVSLLTGQLPDRHFLVGMQRRMRTIASDTVSLPQYFKQNGYITKGVGKIFDARTIIDQDSESWSEPFQNDSTLVFSSETGSPEDNYQEERIKEGRRRAGKNLSGRSRTLFFKKQNLSPVTECLDVPDNAYTDGAIADFAVKYIKEYASGKEQRPLFFAIGFKKPHLPFVAPKKYWDIYDPKALGIAALQNYPAESPEIAWNNYREINDYSDLPREIPFSPEYQQHLRHGYAAAISYVDAQIGKVLQAVKDCNLWDRTDIVILGDHGFFLGDKGEWGKHSNYEQAVRSPLIIRSPGILGGMKTVSLSEFIDVFPTLCDLNGLRIPEWLDGKSLVSVMKDPATVLTPVARSQYERAGAIGYTVRNGEYRYVEWREQGFDNRLDEVTGTVLSTELYYYGPDENITKGESRNLSGDPEQKNVLIQMQKELDKAFPYLSKRTGELVQTPKPSSEDNSAALFQAVKDNDLRVIGDLLKNGVSSNSFDPERPWNSCLIQAVQSRSSDACKMLLKYGANMHQRNSWSQSAWTEAHRLGNPDIINILQSERTSERIQ